MKKFSLLLLDANVVIELCRQGLWDRVLEPCEILLARTVFEEASFYFDDNGDQVPLTLEEDERASRIRIVEVPAAEVVAFKRQFTELVAGDIDDGEAESLAYVCSQQAEHLICSADKIVFRVLGALGRGEQGVSLDEILGKCGLSRKLAEEFGRKYRESWTRRGAEEMLQGRALRKL
jgi:hypothetical protein